MAELTFGATVDPSTHQRGTDPAAVPTDELTTHGVIVGMTGSGKTGLGVTVIEECLRAGVPALLIDPKGDLTNLALTFPGLSAAEFAPWVNPSDASKAGASVEEFAATEAKRWSDGLAGWGLGAADVTALHEAAPVTIYTPGSGHGVQLNIIGTLDVPVDLSDPQATQEEIDAYVGSLLNLVGITADPLGSREHILLSTIIHDAWSAGRSLDLATLVASVQQPPVRKIGVLELDSYYPAEERVKLALKLNGLLASPAFAAWQGGQRIDIESMLRTPDGRPRCAVITTAHLDDEQRQSATSVILAKLISWMRRQSGTTDLRTLLYMDEVAGYLPPTGNPPTKPPIMLLLKQARAFGIGVVLSTQNPVDVDYKALSNAGTWMIGRLQTEQDKRRLLDGLTSAAGSIDTDAVAATISALGKREFVLKRASRDSVQVFTTRWAMSYLRGPLTRDQIGTLRAGQQAGKAPVSAPAPAPAPAQASDAAGAPAAPTQAAPPTPPPPPPPAEPGAATPPASPAAADSPAPAPQATAPLADDETPVPPKIASGIRVSYLDPAASWAASVGAVPGHRLTPAVIARVKLEFEDRKAGVVEHQEHEAVLTPITAYPTAEQFTAVDYDDRDLLESPPAGAIYRLPPSEVSAKTWWTSLQRALTNHLVASMTKKVQANPDLKLFGRVNESDAEFATRCQAAADEGADREIAKLRAKYEAKIATLQARVDAAFDAVARAQSQRTATMTSDALGGLLGGLFGGRRTNVSSAARRATSAQNKVSSAQGKAEDLERGLADLQTELDAETAGIRAEWQVKVGGTTTMEIGLDKSDVRVTSIGLVWIPTGT